MAKMVSRMPIEISSLGISWLWLTWPFLRDSFSFCGVALLDHLGNARLYELRDLIHILPQIFTPSAGSAP